MPFNEFVTWRSRRFPQERHAVISWDRVDPVPGLDPTAAAGPGFLLDSARRRFPRLIRLARSRLAEFRAAGLPAIVHLHQPRSGLWFHLARPWLGARVPVVFTVHSSFGGYATHNQVLSTLNFLLADRVTFVSRASESAYPAALRRLRSGATRTIRNGVDLERVDAVAGANAGTAGFRPEGAGLSLVNVGRFIADKNQDFLLQLMPYLPADTTLTLVGDGPLRAGAEGRARELGVASRVRFLGLLPREQVFREVGAADVFVSGSVREGLPVAVLEAMALRRPVVLSDIAPHRELAALDAGVPVLPLQAEAWRGELLRLDTLGPAGRAALGAALRRTVETALSLGRMHEEFSLLYGELTGSGGGGAGQR